MKERWVTGKGEKEHRRNGSRDKWKGQREGQRKKKRYGIEMTTRKSQRKNKGSRRRVTSVTLYVTLKKEKMKYERGESRSILR